MGLVLEHEDPVLLSVVGVDLDLHGACVDLLALVERRDLAVGFQLAHCHGRHIHERNRLALSAQLLADAEIVVISILNIRGCDLDLVNGGEEGCVTAVIGPVGVDHADFGNRGIAVLGVAEIALAERDIIEIHCETVLLQELFSALGVELAEAVQCLDRFGDRIVGIEGIDLLQRSLAALDRVDEIRFQALEFLVGNGA